MPRPRTKAEDIVDKERYARKWLYYEKLNFHKKQAEIEDNETSIDAVPETDRSFEYAIAVNKNGELFDEALSNSSEFAWIEKMKNPTLYDALQSLSDEQKRLLTFLFVDELSQEQAAQRLGIKQQSVLCRLATIKKNIKSFFGSPVK